MQEGWECKKCHNVYSPNTPFCLYCWFQQNMSKETNVEIANTEVVVEPVQPLKNNIQVEQKPILETTNNESSIDRLNLSVEEMRNNKDLTLDTVDITIPTLNKEPIYPLSDKFPDTKIFLAGMGHSKERSINRTFIIPYILDSIIDFPTQPSKLVRQYFDYIKKNNIEHLMDSGAFSYMNRPKKSFNLKDHLKQYCYYINEFDLINFIELDLDVFMSISEVENIRKKIYLETHKQPIIVYHGERGHDYWINMCKENDYVAIGGLVTSNEQNTPERFEKLSLLCDEAHSYNTRVHGLGFTPLALLNSHTMFFDTVDSTSWNTTKHGQSTIINAKGQLEKIPQKDLFSASDGQEEDLYAWATFAANYKGGMRI